MINIYQKLSHAQAEIHGPWLFTFSLKNSLQAD